MTYSSDFNREAKRQRIFVQHVKIVCYLTIALYVAATSFAICEYLAEMKALREDCEQTVIFVPHHPTAANFELVDVSSGVIREVSAYNSVPEQTDGDPCISANGSNICERFAAGECLIAGNFAKFETKHYLEGIGLCTLIDRMNVRYTNEVDLFMGYDVQAAKKFGRQQIIVKSLN